MLKRTFYPKPSANRYGLAVAVALVVHLLILLAFSVNLRSASVDTSTVSQIQATLIDHTDNPVSQPSPPPVKKAPPPPPPVVASVVKTKTLALEQAADGTIEQNNTSTHKIKATETPDKKVNKASQPLKQIKQLSMDKALEQEVQKTSEQLDHKILSDSLSAEISAESKKQASAAANASKVATATSTASTANTAEINRYKAMILQQIQQNWIVPLNVEQLSCELQVQLAPGGSVLRVTLLHSSGNDALDRSAIAAVNKASPLPVPKDTTDFGAFRNFTITVKPA